MASLELPSAGRNRRRILWGDMLEDGWAEEMGVRVHGITFEMVNGTCGGSR